MPAGSIARRVQDIEILMYAAVQEGGLWARVRRLEERLFAPAAELPRDFKGRVAFIEAELGL